MEDEFYKKIGFEPRIQHLEYDSTSRQLILIIEIKSDVKQDGIFYKTTYTKNYSKVLTRNNLFDRLWMWNLANRIS